MPFEEEIYTGFGIPYEQTPVVEPSSFSLQGIGEFVNEVGQIFDNGMDIYQSARGRVQAQEIIVRDQVVRDEDEGFFSDDISATTYARATAEAIGEQFKQPIIIAAVVVFMLGMFVAFRK